MLVLNVPNILTLFRVVLIPVFVVLMGIKMYSLAVTVFIVAAVTDFFDGYWARKLNQITDFGKLMDPIADKVLVMSALVMLVGERAFYNAEPWVPAWMVVMILARETWVNGIRNLAAKDGVVMAAGLSGKVKSFLQMFAIVLLLLHDEVLFQIAGLRFDAQFVGERLLLISIVFSYWGAVEYTVKVFSKKS